MDRLEAKACREKERIDYRDLLRRYMDHVLWQGGSSHVLDITKGFSDCEVEVLREMREEIVLR